MDRCLAEALDLDFMKAKYTPITQFNGITELC